MAKKQKKTEHVVKRKRTRERSEEGGCLLEYRYVDCITEACLISVWEEIDGPIRFSLKPDMRVIDEASSFEAHLQMSLAMEWFHGDNADDGQLFATLHTLHIFRVPSWDPFRNKDGRIVLPRRIVEELLMEAYYTARGVMIERSASTKFAKQILMPRWDANKVLPADLAAMDVGDGSEPETRAGE